MNIRQAPLALLFTVIATAIVLFTQGCGEGPRTETDICLRSSEFKSCMDTLSKGTTPVSSAEITACNDVAVRMSQRSPERIPAACKQ